MNTTLEIFDAVSNTRKVSIALLNHYYDEGVISEVDLAAYAEYLSVANSDLEYKLHAIFGVCESRLQVKKGKQ